METARPVAGAGGAGDGNGQEQVQSNTRPPAAQHQTFHEADRQRALAELRVVRLRVQLGLAEIDHLGLLLKDNLVAPWGARARLAEIIEGEVAE